MGLQDSLHVTKSMNLVSLSSKALPAEIIAALDTAHFNSLDLLRSVRVLATRAPTCNTSTLGESLRPAAHTHVHVHAHASP
eukprot:2181230-Amphidinium_carterae.1